VHSIYETGATADRFDVDLLVKLNDEYASRPIVTAAPSYDSASLANNARRRLNWVNRMVDLRGKRTLEIGCGNGFEVWSLAHNYQGEAWGVDVTEYGPWAALTDSRTHFAQADLAQQSPFEENFFDRVISFTVWEHVSHPYSMLAETYKVLKPGGLAWIRANLFAGPKASHRYRDIFFPWPHLLFTDEVVRDWDVLCGRKPLGFPWVNRLSWLHYRFFIEELGFSLRHLSFTESPFDENFYTRFENILGRYPRWDLTRDYFLVVLEKPVV
jgi:SAM-dependent methyltransferase